MFGKEPASPQGCAGFSFLGVGGSCSWAMQAMQTQPSYCSRSCCVVAADKLKLPQGQAEVGSLAPQ